MMFEDLDDDGEVRVPDDALARARATGATRVRRHYAIVGGVALALLVAASIPLLSNDEPKTSVGFTNEPTTSSGASDTTVGTNVTASSAETTTEPTKESVVPEGLFAGIANYLGDDQSAVVTRFDGTGRKVLVKGSVPYRPSEVLWSPDRSLLAITTIDTTGAARPQYGQPVRLDVFDPKTGRVRRVYDAPHGSMFATPTWSKDSSAIAMAAGEFHFVGEQYGFPSAVMESPQLRVVDVNTKETWAVEAARDVQRIVWSDDGAHIAFSDGQQAQTIHVVDVDKHSSQEVVSGVDYLWSWSPDARQFAFTHYDPSSGTDKGIEVIGSDGQHRKVFADNAGHPGWRYGQPEWSPDGNRVLAYSRSPATDGPEAALVVDVASSRFTFFEGFIPQPPVENAFRDTRGSCWDRDGDAVLLVKLGFFAIYRTPLDRSEPVALTEGILSRWMLSPRGDAIAWGTQNDGAGVRRLPNGSSMKIGAADEGPIGWTPDGAAVVTDTIKGNGPQMTVTVTRLDGRGRWSFTM